MYQRILVPFDGSETSTAGLDEAIRLATLARARIRLLHVVDGLTFVGGMEFTTGDVLGMLIDAGAQILSQGKARVEASGVPVDTYMPETFGDRVCDVVVAQARSWPADLIVIGTHGRRGVGRLLIGSDAEQIVRAAPVPVLLVRSPAPRAPAGSAGDAAGAPAAASPAA